MDPISLTASIVALVGAGGSVAKGFRKLISLKQVPESLLQLNKEVSDLQLVVSATQELCWQHNESFREPRTQPHHVLENALKKAKTAILELEVLIAYVLTKATAGGEKVDHFAWIREESKTKVMKERLRASRMDIMAAASLLSL